MVYIDDILIYSKTKAEQCEQVRKVLQKLKEAGLYAIPEKCEFNVERTTFLSFIISANGIEIDPAKVEAVFNWETPNSVKDIQYLPISTGILYTNTHTSANLCLTCSAN